jgi:outer membrane protein assembly factor BamB
VAADDDHVFATYIGGVGERSIALAARTGKPVWEHDGGAPRPGRPGDHVVALVESAPVVGLDADTGQQRWQRTDVASLGERVDSADGRIVLRSGESTVNVVDIATGKDLWTKPVSDVVVTRASGIVLMSGKLMSGEGEAGITLTLYDAATGGAIGTPAHLAPENDQVTVPMQIDSEGRIILARGCPGRG